MIRLFLKGAFMMIGIIISIETNAQLSVKINNQDEIVFPFTSNKPDLYLDSLSSKSNFKEIEIFAMGEATHGSKEFFEIKAKSFEYLVTHCGFMVFGIEASYGECCYINDYLSTGIGEIDSVMKHFSFWTWRTNEVRDLLLWIKNYNDQKVDSLKVSFYGFDMQDVISPLRYVFDFIKSDSRFSKQNIKVYEESILTKPKYYNTTTKDSVYQDTLYSASRYLSKWFSENEDYIKRSYSAEKYNTIFFCIDNFNQAIARPKNRVFSYRDSCMASNISKIQKWKKQKIFIWAHNGHVNKLYPQSYPSTLGKPMGYYLKEEYKEKYYTVGFVFNQGFFQAIQYIKPPKKKWFQIKKTNHIMKTELVECFVPEDKNNTLTNELSKINQEVYFIDIQSSSNILFNTSQKAYQLGAVFFSAEKSVNEFKIKEIYDGLIYVNRTTRAIPVTKK